LGVGADSIQAGVSLKKTNGKNNVQKNNTVNGGPVAMKFKGKNTERVLNLIRGGKGQERSWGLRSIPPRHPKRNSATVSWSDLGS